MATDKLFTVVGVSTHEGETKVRFANDVMRVKVLAKNGHTDIMLIELDEAMSKLDGALLIKGLPEFAGADAQIAIDEFIVKNSPKAPKPAKEPKAVKEPKPKATKATVPVPAEAAVAAAIAAEIDEKIDATFDKIPQPIDEDEDAPF